ncbi:hypothetical protein B0H65DRAFT_483767 [Neurospora tetraspora]|uniref:G-patch domain-containing protein n=1 Tax=Neurospora tetraspora TaxID=94610 RepID=A0AAE0JNA3_9PEZI|nr:hypothetical protein B0H65DRAFT_483767 [Neurospora tetraspora]
MSSANTKYGERLLKSQGWRGKGYSLHPTDNSIGLSNPLRISRNTDGRGIGQSTHYTSDQWWLAAFDEKLKGLDTSKDGKVVQTTTQSKLDAVTANIGGGKYTGAGGLYASFVRGEGLAGTVERSEESGRSTPTTDREYVAGLKGGVKKKQRDSSSKKKEEKKEEKKRRKAMEKLKKKEEKKKAKKAAKKEEKKKRRSEGETKEERKARKKERRAKKEEKRRRRAEKEKEKKG